MSTTYPVPGFEEEYPAPRQPDVRIRVVPNETLLPGPLAQHLGELIQTLVELGADQGASIEIDTSDRTRPGEQRGGASPVEGVAIAFLIGLGSRELARLADRCFDALVDWALRHRRAEPDQADDPIVLTLYGPDGKVLRYVQVPQGRGDASAEEKPID